MARRGWLAIAGCAISVCAAASVAAEPGGLEGVRVLRGELDARSGAIVAGPVGATCALAGGAEVRVDAGARFRLSEPGSPHTLRLESGSLTARIAGEGDSLVLEGPRQLRALLQTGELSLHAEGEHAAVVSREGKASISTGESWRELPVGITERVGPELTAGARRAMSSAPGAPRLSRRLLLEGAGSPGTTTVSWVALGHTRQYEVDVRDAAGMIVLEQRTLEPRAVIQGLPPGDHRVSVCAVDDAGLCGARGPDTLVHVLGLVALPATSRGRDGSVRLAPKQRVAITRAEGLELAYAGLPDFVPLPPTLGLIERRPISVRLRQASTGETLDLLLEPMTIRAEIVLGDYRYGWPAEGLGVVVTLIDEQGYAVPDPFFVRARVSVNAARLEPHWQREGPVLRAFVEQPDEFGPWMVRVELFDENGLSLGADITEIGYRLAPGAEK